MQQDLKFATAFNCMDGRCQGCVSADALKRFGVDVVDMITEPGIDGILAGKKVNDLQPQTILGWLRFKAGVSTGGHKSTQAVVVGHAGCAGNNVSDDEHRRDIAKAVTAVKGWGIYTNVVGLFSFRNAAGEWVVEPIEKMEAQAA